MVIGFANLVFGGRGSESEDIVVLSFHHHCVSEMLTLNAEKKKRKKGMGERGHEEVKALQF